VISHSSEEALKIINKKNTTIIHCTSLGGILGRGWHLGKLKIKKK
jgi:hypothetical protein